MRDDWEDVKDEVMYNVVYAKFTQHPILTTLLLSTEDVSLQENSPHDSYWGIGKDGTGRNQLGKTLMRIRDEIRDGTAPPVRPPVETHDYARDSNGNVIIEFV